MIQNDQSLSKLPVSSDAVEGTSQGDALNRACSHRWLVLVQQRPSSKNLVVVQRSGGCGIAAQAAGPDRTGRLTAAQALDRLYVHEGASLGSRMIHAAQRRDVEQPRRYAFFAGYGAARAVVWHRANVTLAAGITGEAEINEAAEAANAAFDEIDCIMR